MKLTQDATKKILDDFSIKGALSGVMKKHMTTIERWAKENRENGPLTTVAAIESLKTSTGLSQKDLYVSELQPQTS